ncbi:hypothetical protein BDIM_05890 [Brevundimonas diminuta ATCC 11568]|nr:hypothetical protein BDIM_05890 [Brevundimonas diminuta ATCC 11568]
MMLPKNRVAERVDGSDREAGFVAVVKMNGVTQEVFREQPPVDPFVADGLGRKA